MAPPAADMAPFIASQQQYTALVEKMMLKDVERAEAEARKAREEAEAFKNALPKPLSVDEQFDLLERSASATNASPARGRRTKMTRRKKTPLRPARMLGTVLGNLPLIERGLAHAANIVSIWKTGRPLNMPAPLANPAPNGTALFRNLSKRRNTCLRLNSLLKRKLKCKLSARL